jgi:serine/arginine repetitive matrix protein 2
MDFTPVAGPSARSQFSVVDEEDDNQPTPRMQLKTIPSPSSSYGPNFEFGASTSSATPSVTPAARLRALLARSSDLPSGKYTPARPFVPPSETGSGTAPSATPSIIRDSLKDLFSHARREPGDTPQKSRPRRSSFDSSEMDITPVVGREREQHKGKRKSLSDDEVDKPSASFPLTPSYLLSHHNTYQRIKQGIGIFISIFSCSNIRHSACTPHVFSLATLR